MRIIKQDVLGNRIIEICELGEPQSIIQRQGNPITELIKTTDLIDELNEQLRIGKVNEYELVEKNRRKA